MTAETLTTPDQLDQEGVIMQVSSIFDLGMRTDRDHDHDHDHDHDRGRGRQHHWDRRWEWDGRHHRWEQRWYWN
jgi:ABC-type nickel/cobalt efflux system permease component RcnA